MILSRDFSSFFNEYDMLVSQWGCMLPGVFASDDTHSEPKFVYRELCPCRVSGLLNTG
jgi:hypothetical protein